MPEHERFFVVTGGPGSGKTTLIDALKVDGFHAMPEAGRSIIQDRVARGAAPRGNGPAHFAELMLAFDMHNHAEAGAMPGPILFDRGIPDLVGYLNLMNVAVPDRFAHAAEIHRYNPCVFFAPHWPQVYSTDAQRDQTPDEAYRTSEHIAKAYREFGYELVPLPLASVSARVAVVKEVIAMSHAKS